MLQQYHATTSKDAFCWNPGLTHFNFHIDKYRLRSQDQFSRDFIRKIGFIMDRKCTGSKVAFWRPCDGSKVKCQVGEFQIGLQIEFDLRFKNYKNLTDSNWCVKTDAVGIKLSFWIIPNHLESFWIVHLKFLGRSVLRKLKLTSWIKNDDATV